MWTAPDPDSPTPPYEQLRAQIARAVQSGAIGAGERLPPVRTLAGDLSMAANTVARTYRELEADGVVVTRGRAGTFVAETAATARTDVTEAAAAYALTARRAGLSQAEAIRAVERAWVSERA